MVLAVCDCEQFINTYKLCKFCCKRPYIDVHVQCACTMWDEKKKAVGIILGNHTAVAYLCVSCFKLQNNRDNFECLPHKPVTFGNLWR